jgi:hypothetical protein
MYQTQCFKTGAFPTTIKITGETARNRSLPGLRTEGIPPLEPWIPNQVIYIEEHPEWRQTASPMLSQTVTASKDEHIVRYRYSYAIVFSCMENYLWQPLFSVVQIFSRHADTPRAEINRLVAKAKQLVRFDETKLKYPQRPGCIGYPQTLR